MQYTNQAASFLTEINSNKNHVIKIVEQPKSYNTRSRRGLINMVGRVANVLFGVCDDTDAKYFHDKIKELERSKSQLFQITETQTQIMKSILTNVNSSLIELEKKQGSLVDGYNHLLHKTDVIEMDVGILKFQNALTERIALLNVILTQYAYETENLVSIVNSALLGHIHPSLLDASEFNQQLKQIKIQLPIGLGLPIDLAEKGISELLRIVEISVVYVKGILMFIMEIPLIDNYDFMLYKSIPLPVKVRNRCQLSIRDAVYVLQATLEALNFNVEEYVINQTSIHRHHIYELILRSVFEIKIPEVTSSPAIPFFKNFQKQRHKLDINKYNIGIEDQACGAALENVKEDILNFVKSKLETKHLRGDYREFLELIFIFIGGNLENKIKMHPPGAMHQARWMARAIYCLKIFLFRSQYIISGLTKKAIGEICVFIIKFYVKAWFTCPLPNKSPNQDLQFIKDMKLYEVFDREISRVSIQKLCNHLWYLTEEAAALSFFDDSIPLEVKRQMVKALKKKATKYPAKRLIIKPDQIDDKFIEKNIDAFITEESLKLFSRFNIDDGFLKHDPTSWESSESYINGKKIINSLKIVNDTAERAVKLMEEYNFTLTLDEEQKQFILKCVQEHRKIYPDCKNSTLQQQY
ncbi:hypothetical protein QTP88_024082 [Uroleucon formosanum]